ncbi:MAG: ABC transporter transmembrane domain-containing protein [Pseudorhodobacter sp.]
MIEPNITRYIWTHTRLSQVWILCIVVLSMVPYFLSFNLPKQIVNGPIQGAGFETEGATQVFMRFAPDIPGIGPVVILPGLDLTRLDMLWALSAVFLGLVIINGLFKLYINTYKGRLGERLLRRLRFQLVDNILRLPPEIFKRMKSAEVAGMVKDEVEPMGGFAGEAFVTPALLGGQAATALMFIFLQSVPLGVMTAVIVTIQAVLIPRMRRRLLALGRERQLTARELAGRVSEIVDGIHTVHTSDTSNWERADIASRLGRIFSIRFDIYKWKFLVKFINNFLAQLTPFLFYAVGGWLALNGQLDVGQLVAVIAAYKDLPGPMKELIDWDQNRQDVQVKYQTVVSQFAVDGAMDPALQEVDKTDAAARLTGSLAAKGVSLIDDSGATALAGVSLTVQQGETLAVVGETGAGGDTFAEVMVRLATPTSGRVLAGEDDIRQLPEAVTGRGISYAGPESAFFFGTLRDNLIYGLRHAPLQDAPQDNATLRGLDRAEALRAGNPDYDPADQWIDFAHAGASGPEDLETRIQSVLDCVGLSRDIFDMALRSPLDRQKHAAVAAAIVDLRSNLRDALREQSLDDLIVAFAPGAYNAEATVLENMMFGQSSAPELQVAVIGYNPLFVAGLERAGLEQPLFALGREIARTAIELFGDLPPDHPIFQSQSLVRADDLPNLRADLAMLDAPGKRATAEARAAMVRLSFAYIEPRHRFGLMTPELEARIVQFRDSFRNGMPAHLRDGFESWDPDSYIASAGVLDNLLFGRISQKYRDGAERIQTLVVRLVRDAGLYDVIFALGMDYHLGVGGKRLSAAQRQKLALARAVLRRSAYYVFNRPLTALDLRSQDQIVQAVLAHLRTDGCSPGVLWVLASPLLATRFDAVAVFAEGRVAETGVPQSLIEKKGLFAEMLSA